MSQDLSLRDFVSHTITDLIDAIHDAQVHASKFNGSRDGLSGAWVNPTHFEDGKAKDQLLRSMSRYVAQVEFDVALTAVSGSGDSKGIGVALGAIGIGGKAERRFEDQQITRIRFTVPVIFPAQLKAEQYDSAK